MQHLPVDLYTMERNLTELIASAPDFNPQLMAWVDDKTINRGSFDFYSWSYWGKTSNGRDSISALVTGTYNKFQRFTELAKAALMQKIEATLPKKLRLIEGSKFRYAGEDEHKNMTGQDYVVLGMHRTGDSIIVYYMPERTPVANHSMFHYGLYKNYKVTKGTKAPN
jgi:hypothetical protein